MREVRLAMAAIVCRVFVEVFRLATRGTSWRHFRGEFGEIISMNREGRERQMVEEYRLQLRGYQMRVRY